MDKRNEHKKDILGCSERAPQAFLAVFPQCLHVWSCPIPVPACILLEEGREKPRKFSTVFVFSPGSERHQNSSWTPAGARSPPSWVPWSCSRLAVALGVAQHHPGSPCAPSAPAAPSPCSTGTAPRAAPEIPSRGAPVNTPRLKVPS